MLIKCKECGKEIKNTEKVCPNCGYPISKSKKLLIISILIAIMIVLLLFLSTNKSINTSNKTIGENYDISTNLHSVVKVNDEYFNEKKEDKYKDYELIFISFSLKNETNKNFDYLTYILNTNNGNTYSITDGNHITNDYPYCVETFLKIIRHEKTNEQTILGGQEKRCIIGFLIPKNEFQDKTNFKLKISKDYNIQPIEFTTQNITESKNLKELFLDNEIEEVEQRISLYYTINNLSTYIQALGESYNKNDLMLFSTSLALSSSSLNCELPVNWNGQWSSNEEGYLVNFTKSKNLFLDIKDDISRLEESKEGLQNIDNALKQYHNLSKINYNELKDSTSGIILSWINIDNFFK